MGEVMAKRKQCISSDEAVLATKQHTKPCSDCLFARTSLPGWTGGSTVEEWLSGVRSDAMIPCHTLIGAQCAGAAIFRKHMCKLPRDAEILQLAADRVLVFATPAELIEHHGRSGRVLRRGRPVCLQQDPGNSGEVDG